MTPRARFLLICSRRHPALRFTLTYAGLGMIAVLAPMAWLGNLRALVTDLVSRRSLGTVFGLVAAGSAVGGILMKQAAD